MCKYDTKFETMRRSFGDQLPPSHWQTKCHFQDTTQASEGASEGPQAAQQRANPHGLLHPSQQRNEEEPSTPAVTTDESNESSASGEHECGTEDEGHEAAEPETNAPTEWATLDEYAEPVGDSDETGDMSPTADPERKHRQPAWNSHSNQSTKANRRDGCNHGGY